MSEAAYWHKKITGYSAAGWADKPSPFVMEAKEFFPKQGRVLEIGCGTGWDGIRLAEQGYDVTQTDLIDEFFTTIAKAAREKGVQTKLLKLDARELNTLPAASFEVIFANLSLHYFDMVTTQAIFAEIHRILTPGGIFAGLFNSVNDPEAGEGIALEENFYQVGDITKRFLDVPIAHDLTNRFTPLVIDDKGAAYKDQAKGVQNLIRVIVKK